MLTLIITIDHLLCWLVCICHAIDYIRWEIETVDPFFNCIQPRVFTRCTCSWYSSGIFSLSLVCLRDTRVHLLIAHSVPQSRNWHCEHQRMLQIRDLSSFSGEHPSYTPLIIYLWYLPPPTDIPIPFFSRLNLAKFQIHSWLEQNVCAQHCTLSLGLGLIHPSARLPVHLFDTCLWRHHKGLVACWATEPHSWRGNLPRSASFRREFSTLGAVPSWVSGLHSWGPVYLEPKSFCILTPMFTLCEAGWQKHGRALFLLLQGKW